MRVAFLTWRDTGHPDGGGSEVFVESIGRELASRGHRVTVVCARYPGSAAGEQRDGIRFVRRGGRLSVYPRALRWLLSREGRRQDVVVDVVNGLPFAAALVRRRGVVALVHHLHRDQWRIIYPGLAGRVGWMVESRLMPLLYRRRHTVTVSDSSRRDLRDLGFQEVAVVHNGTPHSPRGRLARSKSPRLVVLSRLVPHKRLELALDAVAVLAAEGVQVHLDVLGDGWWAPQLHAHAAGLDLGDRVHWHGWVDEQTKADLLGRAWLMVLPSVKEGWGISVLEAAQQGTPTLACRRAGGVTESVREGETGVLVQDEDLLGAIRSLLTDRAELARLGAGARVHAASYDWETSGTEFERLCEGARGH